MLSVRWVLAAVGGLAACGPEQTVFDLTDRQGMEVAFLITTHSSGTPGRILGPIGLDDGAVQFGDRPDFVLRDGEEGTAIVLFEVPNLIASEPGLLLDQLSAIRLNPVDPPAEPMLEPATPPLPSLRAGRVPDDVTIVSKPTSLEPRIRALLQKSTLRLPVDPEYCAGRSVTEFIPFTEESELRFPDPELAPTLTDGTVVSDTLAIALQPGALYLLRRGARFNVMQETDRVLSAGSLVSGGYFLSVAGLAEPDTEGQFIFVAVVGAGPERRIELIHASSAGFGAVQTATVVRDIDLNGVAGHRDGTYLAASDSGRGILGSADGTVIRTRWSSSGDEALNSKVGAIEDDEYRWLIDTRTAAYVYPASSETWQRVRYPNTDPPQIGGHAAYRAKDGTLRIIIGLQRGGFFEGTIDGLESIVLDMPPRFAPCSTAVNDPTPLLTLDNMDIIYSAGSLFMTFEKCNAIIQVSPDSHCVSLAFPQNEDFREFFRIFRFSERNGQILAFGQGGRVLTARVPEF